MSILPPIRLSWRRAAVASLLAAMALGAVWQWVDDRIAAVAPERAAAGESLAVTTLQQQDWPRSVGPVALSTPGLAGERARQLASARLDLAINRATAGEPEPFRTVAKGLLQAIGDTEGPLTRPGAAWGRWLATRLAEESKTLSPAQRFELITLADRANQTLATRPQLRVPRKPQPATEPVASSVAKPPPPLPTLVEPPQPEEPAPLAATTPPEPLLEPEPESKPWQPTWSEPSALPLPDAPVTPIPPPDKELSDRQLLAQLLRVSREVAAAQASEASSAGPVSAPRDDKQPTDSEQRLEALRLELALRGYQAIGTEHAESLLSSAKDTRLALVDKLLVTRVGSAARLLLLLTKDSSAEVRAAAVSALGSTTDPALVRAALDAALNDRDPRVGRLAGSLRERLR